LRFGLLAADLSTKVRIFIEHLGEDIRALFPVGFPSAIGWSLLARFSVLIQSTPLKISP
jgi:hypothetical protein